MHLEQSTLIVDNNDDARRFFIEVLGFELAEDSPSRTNDGRRKRRITVRPHGAATALRLAEADGEPRQQAVGNQFGGRVGLFLGVEDCAATYQCLRESGVHFTTQRAPSPMD